MWRGPRQPAAPAVVVIQEIFGVNTVMRDICDGLAAQGFVAVCPDLFWRIEPGIDITDQSEAEWKRAFELFNAFDVDAGVSDIAATITATRALPGVNGKVGAVGYCLGGLLAFLTATRTDADACGLVLRRGHREARGRGRQAGPAAADAHRREGSVRAAGSPAGDPVALKDHPQIEIHTYAGRDHAFAREGGAHYDAADAAKANGRSLTFFKTL
jgi:carboxymethylenebutenolidase